MFRPTRQTRSTAAQAILLAIIATAFLCPAPSLAGDWPQWRGPLYNGSAEETDLPDRYSQTENVRWSADLPGPGESTPIVIGDRVLISSADKNQENILALCFHRDTGKLLWSNHVAEGWLPKRHSLATPSPVTDGKRAIFLYGSGDLAAFDMAGESLWARKLEDDFGKFVILWTYGGSPLLYKGKLYVPVLRNVRDGRGPRGAPQGGAAPLDSFLLCIDPATGKDVWKHVRKTDAVNESPEAYTTPIPFEFGGRSEIMVSGGDYITSHDPVSGKELWRQAFNPRGQPNWRMVVSPTAIDDIIVVSQPRHTQAFAFKAPKEGKHTYDEAIWTHNEAVPDVISPLSYRGRVYLVHGVRKIMACLDPKTGKTIWQADLGGDVKYYASPSAADGKIYCINLNGDTVTLAAGDEFKVLSRASMGGGDVSASIAIADKKLFIRTAEKLYCISE